MSKHGLHTARTIFRGGAITLVNVVLAPADLLPWKAQWQKVANRLPEGGVLVVLPSASRQRDILEQVAKELRKLGRNVTTMCAEPHESGEQE
jgi:hypothetical protein